MSMSTHVIGFRPPDETWQRMKAVYDACMSAGVPVPSEVMSFFDGDRPDPAGVEVRLEGTDAVREFVDGDRSEQGFEVLVDRLPRGLNVIRFYTSW